MFLRVYVNEGIGQVLFFESDEDCTTSYEDRGGKISRADGVDLFAAIASELTGELLSRLMKGRLFASPVEYVVRPRRKLPVDS